MFQRSMQANRKIHLCQGKHPCFLKLLFINSLLTHLLKLCYNVTQQQVFLNCNHARSAISKVVGVVFVLGNRKTIVVCFYFADQGYAIICEGQDRCVSLKCVSRLSRQIWIRKGNSTTLRSCEKILVNPCVTTL